MIALRVVLAVVTVVFGFAWLITGHVAAQCASGFGQFAQALDQRTATECSQYGLIHGAAGLLAVAGAAGLVVVLAISARKAP